MSTNVVNPSVDNAESQAPPVRRAGRYPRAMVLFAVATVVVLTGDLVLKHFAFQFVAGEPVILDPDDPGNLQNIPAHEAIAVIPHVLSLRLTVNTGAVFGIGKGAKWIFIVVSVVAVVVIVRIFGCSGADARIFHVALALILAGALGNLYDRFMYSAVRDMLHLFPGTNLWPWLFNLADAALMVGVGLVLVISLFGKQPQQKCESTRD